MFILALHAFQQHGTCVYWTGFEWSPDVEQALPMPTFGEATHEAMSIEMLHDKRLEILLWQEEKNALDACREGEAMSKAIRQQETDAARARDAAEGRRQVAAAEARKNSKPATVKVESKRTDR